MLPMQFVNNKSPAMRFIKYIEKLETIKYLSQCKRTGTPKALASKLDVSERTLQRMVQQLREQGCPILFNRNRGSYEILQERKAVAL
jgi:predicted DNA-binding transcriptional regulator YafY